MPVKEVKKSMQAELKHVCVIYSDNIIQTMRDPLIVLKNDLRVISANTSFYQTFHLKEQSTKDRLIYELGYGQWDIPRLRYLLEKVLPQKSVFNDFKITQHFRTIGEKTLLFSGRWILNEDSSEKLILLAIEDITEKQRTELQLQESEQKFRELFDHMSTCCAIFEAKDNGDDFVIKDFNHAASKTEKVKSEDVIGKSVVKVFPSVKEFGLFDVFKRVWKTGNPEFHPVSFYKDQRIAGWRENYVSRLSNGDVVAVYDNVTEHKRAEEEFRLHSEAIKNLNEGVSLVRMEDGRIVYTNPKFEEMFGYLHGEMIGRNISIIHASGLQNPKETAGKIGEILKRDGAWHGEVYNIKKNGTPFWSYANTSLFNHPKHGEVMVAVQTNITERKKAEEVLKRDKKAIERLAGERAQKLVETRKKLEDSRRLSEIGTLAATIAHELRNPLGVISIANYNIKRKTKDNPALNTHLANIDKKVQESNQIIKNLLSYARIQTPACKTLVCNKVLEECIDNIRHKYEKWNIEIEYNTGCKKAKFINADPLQLSELYYNILDNACQAVLGKKKGIIQIRCACARKKALLTLTFVDNGCGINREDLPALCKPFFTRRSKGTGLGLAVCKQIVDLHNGEIGIESEIGKGTKVTVVLPIQRGGKDEENENSYH